MELFNEDITPKRTLGEIVSLDNVVANQSIVNGSFNGGTITIGSKENVFKVDRNGIYLGASSFSTAPFRVDMQGNLVASSATIAGDIVSDNYIIGVSGYKLEYSTGIGYFNNIVITGGTIGGQSVSNIANVSNSTALTAPAGLVVSGTAVNIANDGTISANITLNWTAETDQRFSHYQIRYKKSSFTYYQYINSNSNTVTIDGLTPNTSYDFAVSSVNKYGILSTYSSTVTSTTATSTIAPATVSGVSATGAIQYIIVEWTSNSEKDLSSYNVYRNTVNNSGTATLIGNCKTNYFVDGGRTGGTEYFYWVKAVNTSGLVSTDFSTVVSATPRNVTSDDVVTLAGSKVLIDGTTYLSNWRKSGDLTKIDGGSISTGSVTTAQLNFTPVIDGTIIASINASEEGIQISGEHIAISGSTTFSSGYDPITKVNKLGGSYASASSGARVLIFPDTNTGLQIIDNGGADVFKAIIGGDNVGDVIIGNYTGGQGIFYDKSEAKTIFKGSMTAGNITGVTITGGTIQTATSGKRIRILSDSGESPAQWANSLSLIDSSNNSILNFGTEESLIMAIRPQATDDIGLLIQSSSNNSYSQRLFDSSILSEDATGIAGSFQNLGSGSAVEIETGGTGIGLLVTTVGDTTSSTDVVRIDANKKGDALKINKFTNYGRGININMTGTSNNYQPLYITNSGYGGSQITQSNDSSSTHSALLIEQYNGIKPPLYLTNIAVSTHFRRMIWLGSLTIWTSDGTTPNGNLSGSIGDICFGADGGKAYYCTGTTNWTAL